MATAVAAAEPSMPNWGMSKMLSTTEISIMAKSK